MPKHRSLSSSQVSTDRKNTSKTPSRGEIGSSNSTTRRRPSKSNEQGPSRGQSRGSLKGPSRGPSKGPSRGPSTEQSRGRGSLKGPKTATSQKEEKEFNIIPKTPPPIEDDQSKVLSAIHEELIDEPAPQGEMTNTPDDIKTDIEKNQALALALVPQVPDSKLEPLLTVLATINPSQHVAAEAASVIPDNCRNFLELLLRFEKMKHASVDKSDSDSELFPEVSSLKDLIGLQGFPITKEAFVLCACDDTDIARALFSMPLESLEITPKHADAFIPFLHKSLTKLPDVTATSVRAEYKYDPEDIWKRTPFKNHKLTFATVRSILDCFHDFWKSSRNTKDPLGYNNHTRKQLIDMINDILKKCGINNKKFTVDSYREALSFLTDGEITSCSGDYELNVVEFLVKYSGTGKVFKLKTLTTDELNVKDTTELAKIKREFSGIRLEFGDDIDGDGVIHAEDKALSTGNNIIRLLNWQAEFLKLLATFDAGSKFTRLVFDRMPRVRLLQTQANMFDSGNVEEVWTEERKFVSLKPDTYICDPKQFMTRIVVSEDGKGIASQTNNNPPLFQFNSFKERFPNKGPLSFILELTSPSGSTYKWKFGDVGKGKYIKNGPSAGTLEAVAKYGLCGPQKNNPMYPDIASVTCDMRVLDGEESPKSTSPRCADLENLFMKKYAAYAVKCYGDSEQSRMAYEILDKTFDNNWRCILAGVDQISCITAALRRNMAGFCSLNEAKALLIYFPLNETPLGDVDEFGVVLYEFQTFGEKLKILKEGILMDNIENIRRFIDASISHNEDCKANAKMKVSGKIVIDLVVSRLKLIQKMIDTFKTTLTELRESEAAGQDQDPKVLFGHSVPELLELLYKEEAKKEITDFLTRDPTIKQYAIRIMKEAIKVGNMKYMNALTLLETIFDTKTTDLEKQLVSIQGISEYCAANTDPNSGRLLVGFDFKLVNMKLNNSIICSQLKFKYEDYKRLYDSLFEYEKLCIQFRIGGRTAEFITRYTSIISRIEEQLNTLQKNHIENGNSEIITDENSLTSVLFELQKVDTVKTLLEGEKPIKSQSIPLNQTVKGKRIRPPSPVSSKEETALSATDKPIHYKQFLTTKITRKKKNLEEQKKKLEELLKDPQNITDIIKAFNDAKQKLSIDITHANLGGDGGPIAGMKRIFSEGIIVSVGGGKRHNQKRNITVKTPMSRLCELSITYKKQYELFDMLFQLFANVHRQVLDTFFHIFLELQITTLNFADISIKHCIVLVLQFVNVYSLSELTQEKIQRTEIAIQIIDELIDNITYTLKVGFRRIRLQFMNFCRFDDLEGYDSLDDFNIWEMFNKEHSDVIVIYIKLLKQFGFWNKEYNAESDSFNIDLFESDDFTYPTTPPRSNSSPLRVNSFPLRDKKEKRDTYENNLSDNDSDDEVHIQNYEGSDLVNNIGQAITTYTNILSDNNDEISIQYERFLRHIIFLIVILYNANNTYNPSATKDVFITSDKKIYQPDHQVLDKHSIPVSSKRLNVSERRVLSQHIFKSNIGETKAVLKIILDQIHNYTKKLQDELERVQSPELLKRAHSEQPTSEQSTTQKTNPYKRVAIPTGGGSSSKYTRKMVRHFKQIRNTRRNNKRKKTANQTRRNSHKYGSSSTRRKRSLKNNK